jgi:hypothetical protein
MDMGAMGIYQTFKTAGEQGGGMMTKMPQSPRPFWLYYFNVDAIDAPSTPSRTSAARSSMARCRFPASAGSSRASTRRARCSHCWRANDNRARKRGAGGERWKLGIPFSSQATASPSIMQDRDRNLATDSTIDSASPIEQTSGVTACCSISRGFSIQRAAGIVRS